MSGRALGRAIGASSNTVSAIERGGVGHVEVVTIFSLADALRVKRSWLLCGEGAMDAMDAASGEPSCVGP